MSWKLINGYRPLKLHIHFTFLGVRHRSWVGRGLEAVNNRFEDILKFHLNPFSSSMVSPTFWSLIEMNSIIGKVEKILKGSHYLIPSPSPSVKIQIMAGKVCLRCKVKTLMAVFNKLLKKKFVDIPPVMFCLITSSELSRQWFEFYWRWWDWIQAIF